VIITGRLRLPYPSFLTAWSALDLGQPPVALLPGTAISHRASTEQAWQHLTEQGLASGRELTDHFGRTLELIATASTRFYGWFHTGDGDTRSILVAGAKVLAAVDGQTVTLRPSPSSSGAKALIDTLPETPAAPGPAFSAPASTLTQQDGTGIVSTVRPTGQAAVTAKMRQILSTPRTGGGQLYAARRERPGHYKICDQPLSYFDTTHGRMIAEEREAGTGIVWRTLIPADPKILVKRLSALLPR
jgi:ESX secretion-associated protein EspG